MNIKELIENQAVELNGGVKGVIEKHAEGCDESNRQQYRDELKHFASDLLEMLKNDPRFTRFVVIEALDELKK